jgi:hypothetical protein
MKRASLPIVLVTVACLGATPSIAASATAVLSVSATVVTPCDTQGAASAACTDYKIKAAEYAARKGSARMALTSP